MESKKYAVFVGKQGVYERDFGFGNRIKLEQGIARPVSEEVEAILKDQRDVIIVKGVDDNFISFTKRMIKETWQELVNKHGIKKAKEVREAQNVGTR